MNHIDILQKNITLKNIHLGKRCFIIGTGPSIVDQNLSLLKDEIKICLNDFYQHHKCKEINPDYWMTADPNYWREKDRFLIPRIEDFESNGILANLFFPLVESTKIGMSCLLNINYFAYGRDTSLLNEEIDFCKKIPPFKQNAFSVGLMLAFYLGCNPIVFLGADRVWWASQKDEYNGDVDPNFKKNNYNCCPITERNTHALLQTTIYVQRYQFLQLINYAQRKGFEIYNATPGGEMDLIPRINYDSLFAGSIRKTSVQKFISNLPRLAGQLGNVAWQLIQDSQFTPALILIDEALRQNINRSERILGLNYMRALCLNGLGLIREAINEARYDYICNPGNRVNSTRLLQSLGDQFPATLDEAILSMRLVSKNERCVTKG